MAGKRAPRKRLRGASLATVRVDTKCEGKRFCEFYRCAQIVVSFVSPHPMEFVID